LRVVYQRVQKIKLPINTRDSIFLSLHFLVIFIFLHFIFFSSTFILFLLFLLHLLHNWTFRVSKYLEGGLAPKPATTDGMEEKVSCPSREPMYWAQMINQGRAIAQAVSRWLPTAVARVQTRV
jgi:hypothetical protein